MSIAQTATMSARIPAAGRPAAIAASIAGALVVNLAVWLLAAAAGGSFEVTENGVTTSVAPGAVIFSSVVPLLIGMSAAALLSYLWVGVLRVAQVVGSVLAVATIGLTVAAQFDTATTVGLSIMHVVLAPALVVGLEAIRRKLVQD